jgi:hypothetical protein
MRRVRGIGGRPRFVLPARFRLMRKAAPVQRMDHQAPEGQVPLTSARHRRVLIAAVRAQASDATPVSINGRLCRYRSVSWAVRALNGENGCAAAGGAGTSGSLKASLQTLADPEFQFGECFCDGSIGVEGDPVRLLETRSARCPRPHPRPLPPAA